MAGMLGTLPTSLQVPTSCPYCQTSDEDPAWMRDHITMCPRGSAGHNVLHERIVMQLRKILLTEMKIPKRRIPDGEQRCLCADGSQRRPSDLTVEDWDYEGHHLYMHVTGIDITTHTCAQHASRAGEAAKFAEDKKFRNFPELAASISAYRFVPMAFETYGRIGQHADALLREWACTLSKPHYRSRWKRQISEEIHFTSAKLLLKAMGIAQDQTVA